MSGSAALPSAPLPSCSRVTRRVAHQSEACQHDGAGSFVVSSAATCRLLRSCTIHASLGSFIVLAVAAMSGKKVHSMETLLISRPGRLAMTRASVSVSGPPPLQRLRALPDQGLTMRCSEPRPAPMRNFGVVSSFNLPPRAFSDAVADLVSR